MSVRATREQVAPLVFLAALTAIAMIGPFAEDQTTVIAVVVIPLGAILVWRIHPAWTFSIALCLSVFAGNWNHLGIPGTLAPDRLLLVGGVLAVVLRAPPVKHRPQLEFKAVHWVMIVTLAWMVGSALSAGTLAYRTEQFELFERFGLLPFALFLVAPVAFETESHRRILLAALVGLGGYLGYTALMQTLGFDALVWPSYITEAGPAVDRAQGPFLEAVTNGAGLYAGLIGAAMALLAWRKPVSLGVAGIVLLLCAAGLLFTEQRSVWLGGIITTVIALLAVRELRLWFVPAVGAGLAVVVISLAVIPGLASSVTERKNDDRTVWDRRNLNTAGLNIVEARPLTGVGWGRFELASLNYFWQSPDFPLTAQGVVLHNVYLTYAAETGLIGVGLWALTLALGAGAALRRSPDPRARPWQIAFGAFLVFYLVISTFVYAQVFPNNMLWLFAGVAAGVATGAQGRRPAE